MAAVLGLSGGIGSGKSAVARILETLGATVIDADRIVHELQGPRAPMLAEITEAFGPHLVDEQGRLDRGALGAIAFGDAAARRRLEQIVHPKVIAAIAERVSRAQAAGAPLIVVDIPLLFERSERAPGPEAASSFDATVLVYATEQQQIERQMKRDGCDREAALQRIRAQMPIDRKKELADVVIDNTGSLAETERQTRLLFERFTSARP